MPEKLDPFAALGLPATASEAEIRKAFRKLSLALHPDKARDVPADVAAARFHAVKVAYDELMDPAARAAAAEKSRVERAQNERRQAFEGKRKAMADELERDEREGARRRTQGRREAQAREETLARLKEEGRRLREEGQRAREEAAAEGLAKQQAPAAAQQAAPAEEQGPELGPLDLTVRLRFPAEQYAALSGADAPSSSSPLATPLARALSARFGALQHLALSTPKAGKREATALATFATLDAAYAAVCAGAELRCAVDAASALLEDVHVQWAAAEKGKGRSKDSGEPQRIAWLRERGKLGAPAKPAAPPAPEEDLPPGWARPEPKEQAAAPSFSFSMPASASSTLTDDYEAATLLRMRETARRRAEERIRQEEAGA
ncbi:DnaJ-domain-containing protein [Tilletiopsis washingtonensis]|uniref:DnaJ-domain-containing protein n=1 Tax=Tilletiopsis washingtonensis TaxID=58919 RepID=A0A316Z8A8_9BASI|nr:DnaJ-domain-containing protein [Tilletiopsis washingtonensis]PWN97228.1 DnaJ-domain-containing protein [Tilletiopsis washingtonensis]